MPYALFCDDAKLSKTYPTEADVWKIAADCGLVAEFAPKDATPAPRRLLDNDYEIRPCQPEPGECLTKNKLDARAEEEFQQVLTGRQV